MIFSFKNCIQDKSDILDLEVAATSCGISDVERQSVLPMNLSFAGCGLLGIYHLGVVKMLISHGQRLLMNVQRYSGASAGALVASILAVRKCSLQDVEESVKFVHELAEDLRQRPFGVLTPGSDLLQPLEVFLQQHIPNDGHVTATNRLFISVTNALTKENEIVSTYNSKQELIEILWRLQNQGFPSTQCVGLTTSALTCCRDPSVIFVRTASKTAIATTVINGLVETLFHLVSETEKRNPTGYQQNYNETLLGSQYLLASSYIPVLTGSKPVFVNGKKYYDGGMTDNLPVFADGRTISVSPFDGGQEICPSSGQVDTRDKLHLIVSNQSYRINLQNIVRCIHAFAPPSDRMLDIYHQQGMSDAKKFLVAEGFFDR